MKVLFRNIHLYLALTAGLVIMTSCFTGAILVFEDELRQALNHDRYFVEQSGNRLSIDQLVQNAKNEVPKANVVSAKIYSDPLRTVEIGIAIPEKEKEGGERRKAKAEGAGSKASLGDKKKEGSSKATHTVFVNPYSGKVIEVYNYKETFFYQMFALHRWLLGSPKGIGKYITGISAFIFLFILITGIVLWFPKTKVILRQRLKVKWDGSFKRLNHDLHIVLGFYTSIFLFISVFTALYMSFEWVNKGIYNITNSSSKLPDPPSSAFELNKSSITFDRALQVAMTTIKNVEFYNLKSPADSSGVFTVNVLPLKAFEMATDTYYIDQYNSKIIGTLKFSDKNLGQRIKSTIKPVHTGSIFGLPSKIIALIVSLLGLTFPITGVIMWVKRLKKAREKRKILESKVFA